jgi:hypothetical protein
MMRETADLRNVDFLGLVAGDDRLISRLARGERLRAATPFCYPGRRGRLVLELVPSLADADGPERVRISDGGGVIKSLDEQGIDVSVDMVVSKTVFHAVKEVEGANVVSGELYLDSTPDSVPADLWRFLQLAAELLGLRHSKYKDALHQLSCRSDRDPDLINW